MNRKPIFDAIRALLGRALSPRDVAAIDAAIDHSEGTPTMMTTGERGLALIREFEGLRLTSYRCPAGVWTIGYGSTGAHVHPGLTITRDQGEELLRADLVRFEAAVRAKVPNASQNQFDAMVALAFNIGTAAFTRSTVAHMAALGKHDAAADAFALWNKGGGRVLPGLVRRRAAEAALYRSAP